MKVYVCAVKKDRLNGVSLHDVFEGKREFESLDYLNGYLLGRFYGESNLLSGSEFERWFMTSTCETLSKYEIHFVNIEED